MRSIFRIYSTLFSRKIFYKLHKALFLFSLRGLGMLNSENSKISGEDYINKFLQKKNLRTIFDVGANEGQNEAVIRNFNPDATVYSFEPHPASYAKLLKNISSKTKAFNIGLGSSIGSFELYDYDGEDGSQHASLNQEVFSEMYQRKSKSVTVQVDTIDHFCNENGIDQICLLKIDVEGLELEVLKGAESMISEKKIRFIEFEFNSNHVYTRTNFSDFQKVLSHYSLFRVLQDGMICLDNESYLFKEVFYYQNILAIRKDLL
jgi:FkbM family methyltransferase